MNSSHDGDDYKYKQGEIMNKYNPKYKLTHDESFKGFEVSKIINAIDKETKKQELWQMIPFALLFGFAILTILILMGILR